MVSKIIILQTPHQSFTIADNKIHHPGLLRSAQTDTVHEMTDRKPFSPVQVSIPLAVLHHKAHGGPIKRRWGNDPGALLRSDAYNRL